MLVTLRGSRIRPLKITHYLSDNLAIRAPLSLYISVKLKKPEKPVEEILVEYYCVQKKKPQV